jgi:hypothetical protein
MSDPVTNIEIEDVLSSIRRLVSEDTRPASGAGDFAQRDRLVLTPSLRVQDIAQPEPAADLPDAPFVEVPEEDHQPEPPVLLVEPVTPEPDVPVETVEAETEQSDEAQDDSISSEISMLSKLVEEELSKALNTPPQEDALEAVLEEVQQVPSEEAVIAEDVEASSPVAEVESAPAEIRDTALEAKISALEALVAAQNVAVEAVSGTQDAAATPVEPGEMEPQTDPEDVSAEDDSVPPVFQRSAQSLEWEDHTAEELAESPVSIEETQPSAEIVVESEAEPVQVEPAAVAAEVSIDESMLREIVTQIVREELQGPLGERITRNVRKLVRREIHRAFLNQEFE